MPVTTTRPEISPTPTSEAAPPTPLETGRWGAALHRVLLGFDGRSLRAMPLLLLIYVIVGLASRSQGVPPLGTDLLVMMAMWSVMTTLLLWRVRPARDLPLVISAMAGGLLLEWWGTTTELWHYFSAQRPPPWILAAWPILGLATDRLARVLGAVLPRSEHLGRAWWPLVGLGLAALAWLARPVFHIPSTLVVFGVVFLLLRIRGSKDHDASVFLAGTALGVFIEYWGTSRGVWTYASGLVPPPETILAHGLAGVTFVRGGDLLARLTTRLGLPAFQPPSEEGAVTAD